MNKRVAVTVFVILAILGMVGASLAQSLTVPTVTVAPSPT